MCMCVCLSSTWASECVFICMYCSCVSSPERRKIIPVLLPPALGSFSQHDAIYRTQLWGGLLAGPTTLGQTGIEEAIPAQHILTPTLAKPLSWFTRDAEARQNHSRAETIRPGLAQEGRMPENRGGAT